MSESQLPPRASLEYLKKLAKDRLRDLRRVDPGARLAAALLAVAREHGFASWRALKAELVRRQHVEAGRFFEACGKGDVGILGDLLAADPALVRATSPAASHAGWTGLHAAAKAGHVEAVRLLLDHGADPDAREAGDNTTPLHWAAAAGRTDVARTLLDAGADVHGFGDVHELDVIGWAAYFRGPRDDPAMMDGARRELVSLLVDRGARHHIFSALCVGEPSLVQELVEQDPAALDRRMSRFEHGLTPLHFAIERRRYDLLDLLISLGADVDAEDGRGRTPLAMAMLRGDREAMDRLHAAGAKPPPATDASGFRNDMAALSRSVNKCVATILVPDVARALDWYASIGFKETGRYEDDGVVNFGIVSFGKAELMFNMHGKPGRHDVSLWFFTDNVDELYRLLKSRQLDAAGAALAGEGGDGGVEFEQDIEDMFYGARQFCIRDPNGYELYFIQHTGG